MGAVLRFSREARVSHSVMGGGRKGEREGERMREREEVFIFKELVHTIVEANKLQSLWGRPVNWKPRVNCSLSLKAVYGRIFPLGFPKQKVSLFAIKTVN